MWRLAVSGAVLLAVMACGAAQKPRVVAEVPAQCWVIDGARGRDVASARAERERVATCVRAIDRYLAAGAGWGDQRARDTRDLLVARHMELDLQLWNSEGHPGPDVPTLWDGHCEQNALAKGCM